MNAATNNKTTICGEKVKMSNSVDERESKKVYLQSARATKGSVQKSRVTRVANAQRRERVVPVPQL